MSDKPKSALTAMITRIITHCDALHEELHELDDELSHLVSHLLKKIAKLTSYAELETPDRRSPDAVSLIMRNMAEIKEDLADLLEDASSDAAMLTVGQVISNLVGVLNAEWKTPPKESKPATKDMEDPKKNFEIFERSLDKMVPTARADIAVRHSFLALREMAKFWRANDDRLATLASGHEHEHDHGHHHEGSTEEGHHHHEEI